MLDRVAWRYSRLISATLSIDEFAWTPGPRSSAEVPSFGQARRSAFGAKAAPPRAAVAYAPDLATNSHPLLSALVTPSHSPTLLIAT